MHAWLILVTGQGRLRPWRALRASLVDRFHFVGREIGYTQKKSGGGVMTSALIPISSWRERI
jgi:hypothetical protein